MSPARDERACPAQVLWGEVGKMSGGARLEAGRLHRGRARGSVTNSVEHHRGPPRHRPSRQRYDGRGRPVHQKTPGRAISRDRTRRRRAGARRWD